MVRRLLGNLATRSLSVAGKWQQQQLRRLNIHEYQGADLMSKHGINVPRGVAVSSLDEVKKALRDVFPNQSEVVVKSQILAGGRGLGTFKSGLKGGVHIVEADKVANIAEQMLGQILVTKQTGAQGKVVSKVYLCEKLSLVNEMYFAITLDRKSAGPKGGSKRAVCKKPTKITLVRTEVLVNKLVRFFKGVYALSHGTSHTEGREQESSLQKANQNTLVRAEVLVNKLVRLRKGMCMHFHMAPVILLIISCKKGGTSIEDLAEKHPELIVKVPVDVFTGITDEDAAKVVDGLSPTVADRNASIEQVKKLYELFCKCDCTLLEINPIAETSDKQLVAADAKLNFDDNAAFRQKEIFTLRDPTQEDPREVAAAKADLNYIGLDGEIGCMVNGAGLAMATMDIIKLHGGTPANFLDVGGNASESQVVEAFKILTSDEKVKAILVNIFGGIMKCDVIASGIVNAAKQVQLKVPVVVRLEGTNVDQGRRILKESGMTLITAEDLDDAAEKAVKALS
ncbi:hypothetical protein SASPL_107132 [Salvia splendens]|uniref:Succinate--CoA ligase [ADP-forming] subunit beta, mitochondrial n=1 Tax=Salvia splendens TaxID=180675 RepID=A0A8X8YG88_SALSN|nr:hypothetical protein SASPL_107132 [Salvia splendens]